MEPVEDGLINVTIIFLSMISIFVLVTDIIPNCMECCERREPIDDPALLEDDKYEGLV